ncbi:MAG: hypothetical protein GC154_15935 [bacterium]|nr:hypothetical protein [bacterium]
MPRIAIGIRKPQRQLLMSGHRPRILAVVHLHDQDLWPEFRDYLDTLEPYEPTIFITLTEGVGSIGQTDWLKRHIQQRYGQAHILTVQNRGSDIGPFLICMNHVFDRGDRFDLVLKLHTKKSLFTGGIEFGRRWRRELIVPIAGNMCQITECLLKSAEHSVGMIGARRWITIGDRQNRDHLGDYCRRLAIRVNEAAFVGGTMFWIKYEVLERYLSRIDLMDTWAELAQGYQTDLTRSSRAHAFERLFGYMIADSGLRLVGV